MADDGRLPSAVLAEQLKEIRGRQRLSARTLAERVERMGGNLSRATIAKIEVGGRGVSLDEALLLAAALQVAPVHLFIPRDDAEQVRVVPDATVDAVHGRAWVRGIEPLPAASARIFHSEVPDSEYKPPRHATIDEMKGFFGAGNIHYEAKDDDQED